MFSALQDCFVSLKATKHLDNPQTLLDQYNKEIMQELQQVRKCNVRA